MFLCVIVAFVLRRHAMPPPAMRPVWPTPETCGIDGQVRARGAPPASHKGTPRHPHQACHCIAEGAYSSPLRQPLGSPHSAQGPHPAQSEQEGRKEGGACIETQADSRDYTVGLDCRRVGTATAELSVLSGSPARPHQRWAHLTFRTFFLEARVFQRSSTTI